MSLRSRGVSALFAAAHLLAATPGLGAPITAAQKVVVLELTDGANLTEGVLNLLTDEVRGAALTLPGARWQVLTRENIEQLLPPGTALADCLSDCEVALGRRLGADVVVSGALTRFGPRRIQIALRAHHAATAALWAQITAEAPPDTLDATTRQAARQLFAQVEQRATAQTPERQPTTAPSAGTASPADRGPTTQVTFKSNFEGAQLQVRPAGRGEQRRVCSAPCIEALPRGDLYRISADAARSNLTATGWFALPEGDEVTLYARTPDLALGPISIGLMSVGAASLMGTATYMGIQSERDAAVDLGYAIGGLAIGAAGLALGAYLLSGQRISVDSVGGSRGRPLGRTAP